jgi:hypothetical protein
MSRKQIVISDSTAIVKSIDTDPEEGFGYSLQSLISFDPDKRIALVLKFCFWLHEVCSLPQMD